MQTVDEYLAKITPSQRSEYDRIRKIVRQIVPDADEKLGYGIPALTYKGKYLLYFGAFKHHMSVFPGSALANSLMSKLTKFKVAKGTVQFTEDNPLPDAIIKEMVRERLKNINQGY